MEEESMKRMFKVTVLASVMGMVIAGSALAQTADPVVEKRMETQERRIDQGVQSGELTPREAGRLEAEQARVKQTEQRMESDGKLTPKERARLNRMQNRASGDIYRQKHDHQSVNTN
jgi:hypothetical protein